MVPSLPFRWFFCNQYLAAVQAIQVCFCRTWNHPHEPTNENANDHDSQQWTLSDFHWKQTPEIPFNSCNTSDSDEIPSTIVWLWGLFFCLDYYYYCSFTFTPIYLFCKQKVPIFHADWHNYCTWHMGHSACLRPLVLNHYIKVTSLGEFMNSWSSLWLSYLS